MSPSIFGFDIDASYGGGGFLGYASDVYGGYLNLIAPPTDVLSSDPIVTAMIPRIGGWPAGYTVSRGSSIPGTLTIDTYRAMCDQSLGIQFYARLNSTETFTPTGTRWVFFQRQYLQGNGPYDALIQRGNGPFYYTDSDEALNTNGHDSLGSFGKRFTCYTSWLWQNQGSTPWATTNDVYAMLVSVSGSQITVREGVHFGYSGVQAPVPEPASLAALCGGCLLLVRRRRGHP
ncbi:MAG TPA: PEP-CTERM sorting domain-containing protein [Fimbriimonadaceae bacterium]|nr:PEP-CTERM sorting domain-containing protein [Fimbriimonadaceae bacterium]